MGPWSSMTSVPIQGTFGHRCTWRDGDIKMKPEIGWCFYKTKNTRLSTKHQKWAQLLHHSPADTVILDFQPPELGDNKCLLFKPVVLCYGRPGRLIHSPLYPHPHTEIIKWIIPNQEEPMTSMAMLIATMPLSPYNHAWYVTGGQ